MVDADAWPTMLNTYQKIKLMMMERCMRFYAWKWHKFFFIQVFEDLHHSIKKISKKGYLERTDLYNKNGYALYTKTL